MWQYADDAGRSGAQGTGHCVRPGASVILPILRRYAQRHSNSSGYVWPFYGCGAPPQGRRGTASSCWRRSRSRVLWKSNRLIVASQLTSSYYQDMNGMQCIQCRIEQILLFNLSFKHNLSTIYTIHARLIEFLRPFHSLNRVYGPENWQSLIR